MTRADKIIFWLPRIFSLLFLCFLAMFSLDVFDLGQNFWGTLVGLFMHNLPVLFLGLVLAIAWRHEIVGAVFYTLAGVVYIILVSLSAFRDGFHPYMLTWPLFISGPAFAIAGLFYAGWLKKRRT